MYNVLNTLSKYTYLYILKNIISYTFLLVFKFVESLQCILKRFLSKNNNFPQKNLTVYLLSPWEPLTSSTITSKPELQYPTEMNNEPAFTSPEKAQQCSHLRCNQNIQSLSPDKKSALFFNPFLRYNHF